MHGFTRWQRRIIVFAAIVVVIVGVNVVLRQQSHDNSCNKWRTAELMHHNFNGPDPGPSPC